MVIERDKRTRTDLDEARRLFEESGLAAEAVAATQLGQALAQDGPSREVLTLYQVGQIINSILDLEPLLEKVMDLVIETLEAERGLILLLDEATGEPTVVTARKVEKETITDAIKYSESVVRAAVRGQAMLSTDSSSDSRYRDFKSIALYDIKSFMCVPLKLRERTLGTVYVDSRRVGNLFDKGDLNFLEAFANQAALAIENARLMKRLKDENRLLRETVSRQYGFDNVVGRSPLMDRVFKTLAKVAPGQSPVMLLGESGSGKELLAKAIHYNSTRRDAPFLALNCAAIPHELLESELFGHVRGAFSGAERDKKGLIEEASGGTFFFDEIGEMDPALQAKLLRVVEEGSLRRVGETRTRPVNVRFVSATNKDLKAEVAKGRFRTDLYYRLNVVTVRVPPLRERAEDIPLLAEHFLRHARERSGRQLDGFTREAMSRLEAYTWPGNVRELENVVERAVALADGARIELQDLTEDLIGVPLPSGPSSEARVAALWHELTESGLDFWAAVREPFLAHELAREEVRELVRRGLAESKGSYKELAKLFGVGAQYKKFHAFLKNNGCHIEREKVAHASSGD